MKEKREIILFFTRLLMLAVMLAVPVWRDFWNDFCKESGYVPENMCRRSALILQAGTEYSDRDVVVFQKRGHCIQGVLWRERKIR